MDRRSFLRMGLGLAAALPLTGCGPDATGPSPRDPRLQSRPLPPGPAPEPGTRSLTQANGLEALLHIPTGYRHDTPAPFALLLHGAGGNARSMTGFFTWGEATSVVLLAASSTGGTWDLAEVGRFAADVTVLDDLLDQAFRLCSVDPARLALGGFSDGASYALSLGLPNGDLFPWIIAFSPGFLVATDRRGQPSFFISHGTRDTVLPIDQTSRPIISRLEGWGYAVRFEEFDGGHMVPSGLARDALSWVAGAGSIAAAGSTVGTGSTVAAGPTVARGSRVAAGSTVTAESSPAPLCAPPIPRWRG